MAKLRIGLDCDQVICDFINPYLDRFGQPKNDYEITKNVHRVLRTDRDFWLNLPVINIPNFKVELFCSKRVNPKRWSKQYLAKIGLGDVPFYQMYYQHGNKARMIKGRVDVFVDDSVSNWKQLNESGIPCLLMDAESNKHIDTPLRIYSLDYNEIKKIYNEYFN